MKNLKKIVILAFNPPWLPTIQSGEKELEFRDKIGKDWKEGTEVFLAITKNGGGSGMIEARFTIGKIHKALDFVEGKFQEPKTEMVSLSGIVYKKSKLEKLGYNYQTYAIEIKDFQMFDKPIPLDAIFAYNKVEDEMITYAKEFVKGYYPLANKKKKKVKVQQHYEMNQNGFLDNINKYSACKINQMPQSWCYGGVIQND